MSKVTYGTKPFNIIEVTGDVLIEAASGITDFSGSYALILLVGPTGSGKSSFIEALAGPSVSLGIAKDQLDGFTQELSAYVVKNVTWHNNQVIIVDCPGFADPNLSERHILLKIREWLKDHNKQIFTRVLYFTPITDTRLPGSKRDVISMFEEFCGDHCVRMGVITTMWDTLWNDVMLNRAYRNLDQLKTEIWKGYYFLERFDNTQVSALRLVDGILADSFPVDFDQADPPKHVYDNLVERLASAMQGVQLRDDDLAQPDAQSNEILHEILTAKRHETLQNLKKFAKELIDFGPPPPGSQAPAVDLHSLLTVRDSVFDLRPTHGDTESRNPPKDGTEPQAQVQPKRQWRKRVSRILERLNGPVRND